MLMYTGGHIVLSPEESRDFRALIDSPDPEAIRRRDEHLGEIRSGMDIAETDAGYKISVPGALGPANQSQRTAVDNYKTVRMGINLFSVGAIIQNTACTCSPMRSIAVRIRYSEARPNRCHLIYSSSSQNSYAPLPELPDCA